MKILEVNQKKCIKCLACVRDCPARLFSINKVDPKKRMVLFLDMYEHCIKCGHCIAACPVNAVDFEGEELPVKFAGIDAPYKILGYDRLYDFILARRSIRQFKNRNVNQGLVDKIIEVMRNSPTATNAQKISYVVITKRETLKNLSDQVMKMFYGIRTLLKFRFFLKLFIYSGLRKSLSEKTKESVKKVIARHKAGEDPVFFDAPCLIILQAPSYANQSGIDAGIALSNAMLACQSLGLGSCLVGFAHEAFTRNKKLSREFGIRKGNASRGVIAIGYPDVKYYKTAVRKSPKVIKFE